MNLLQIVLKQMRQRALGTCLTILTVLLGVALATAVIVIQREGGKLFLQSDYGYDVLVGPVRGSPLQLTLNTVYNLDVSPGLLDYEVFKQLQRNRGTVRIAIPIAKGDTYAGLPIIGTVPRMFNHIEDPATGVIRPIIREGDNTEAPFEYRRDKSFELAAGRMFHPRRFEAVIGADVPKRAGLDVGKKFKATHGNPKPNETPDIHDQEWLVVGRLARTNTAADRAIHIPLVTFFAIAEHAEALQTVAALQAGSDVTRLASPGGLAAATRPPVAATRPGATPGPTTAALATTAPVTTAPAGVEAAKFHMEGEEVVLDIPESEFKLSAIYVRTRSAPLAFSLMYALNNSNRASASNPATVMREFFGTFLAPAAAVMLIVASLVCVVAAVGILVAIYNSVVARMREIAILRALGATRIRILLIICTEAGLIGLVGGVAGILVGHTLIWAGRAMVPENLGSLAAFRIGVVEVLYLLGIVGLSLLAGLVPALKAYQSPVADNLTT
jgi:putative ABC transport system permease protein